MIRTPRLIATDLDGTLVRRDRTVGPRTAKVLAQLGVPVVLVTGRPIRWLAEVYEQLAIQPLAICANGAAIYDPAADAIVHSEPLTPDRLREACERLRAAVPDVVFAVERDGGRAMRYEERFPVGLWERDHRAVQPMPFAEMVSQPAAKLLVRAGADWTRIPGQTMTGAQAADEFTTLVRACLAGIAEATHSSSSGLAEVSAPGVTKASGLAWVAESLGVEARDVLAFGDMPNDLPMFAWAGFAVAMANGHPAARAAADAVTPATNDEDGVAAYLEGLLNGD